jgi:hypothetical protein
MAATSRQCCEYIDAILRVPEGVASDNAEALRGVGLLPSTQGKPSHLDSYHVALILISTLLGNHRSTGHATRVAEYSAMLPIEGGHAFGQTIAGFIDRPHDLFEVTLDLNAPGAVVTHRRADNGMAVTSYLSPTPHSRPGFNREAIVGPQVFIRLSADIKAAPPVRSGRRGSLDRYRRFERAVVY